MKKPDDRDVVIRIKAWQLWTICGTLIAVKALDIIAGIASTYVWAP